MDIKKIRLRQDEYRTNQKNRYGDITIVNKMIDNSTGWLEHKYLKDNIKRKMNIIHSYVKKNTNTKGKRVTIEEDISDIDFDDLITQIILGNIDMGRLQQLSTTMLNKILNMLDEQIKLQITTIENFKYKCVVYLRQLGNIIFPEVPINNISKFNLIRNISPISEKYKKCIDNLAILPSIDYDKYKYLSNSNKVNGLYGIKSPIFIQIKNIFDRGI